MSNNKIIIANVYKHYAGIAADEKLRALDTINFTIKEREFFCLLGPSGCGKTTLLNILAGFVKPTEGKVVIDGEIVSGPNPRYIAVFQEYGLFPWRTVLGNVSFGLEVNGVERERQNEIASKFIDLVQLQGFEDKHPFELSGGMKQRVAIARALAVNPEIIFMDEPFNALDITMRIKLQEEIIRIWQEARTTFFFVTHNIEEAVYLADRIAVMSYRPGRIIKMTRVNLERPRERTSENFIKIKEKILKYITT